MPSVEIFCSFSATIDLLYYNYGYNCYMHRQYLFINPQGWLNATGAGHKNVILEKASNQRMNHSL